MELVVATWNQDKLKEIRTLLKGFDVEAFSLTDFKNAPKVKENGNTLKENAEKKAVQVSKFLKKLAIADDSGLEIEALGNRPGVYSARFSGKGATYASNNEKALRLLKNIPIEKRKAVFRCVIAVADRGKLVGIAQGKCQGMIGFKPEGRAGFGYDPIFIPSGYNKTFAQMGIKNKNKISHRSKALVKARKIVKKYIDSYYCHCERAEGERSNLCHF